MKIKVLLVQVEPIAGNIEKNIQKVEQLLKDSNQNQADLIVLPELWTVGWDCPNFHKYSEELTESKYLNFLKILAKKYNSNIIGGSSVLHKNNQKDRNTCIILDREGNLLKTYDKFHLFSLRGQSEGEYLEEGTTPVLVKTDIGKIGISICYDIRFPEMFRLYAFNGADIIVNMSAWPQAYKEEYITLAKARAIENQIYFICCGLTGKINDSFNFSGSSLIADYQGRITNSLVNEEKVLTAIINIDKMKEYRTEMPILKDTKKQYIISE